MLRVATDVGGTFTDYISFDDETGEIVAAKSSTTPDILNGIVECFRKGGRNAAHALHFVHGSTVAINTVIEKSGAVTGLLATEGFRHVLDLGRGSIFNSFDIMFETPEALVPPMLRAGVQERMLSDGQVFKRLDEQSAIKAIDDLVKRNVASIAICFLHSYANPAHEQALAALIRARYPNIYVTASSSIIRQYREYERTSTTVLNAYVGPRVSAYLAAIARFLADDGFHGTAMIMQSNGGTMTLEAAQYQPVRMMESGPVGGTMAAAHVGKTLGYENVVAFDMGGTTAKVSMVRNGQMEVADGYFIGGEEVGYPLQLPVVDIIEIGAGGGSIAHLDETGALKIGPVSAGAYPGPACYQRGGHEPTVTDANLALGRLNPAYFLGGEMRIDREAALHAIREHVGKPLKLGDVEAAQGIIRLANLSMAQAVQTMTVQRGYDPREAVMIAYGGGGPLHAVEIARELGIRKVVIPPHCGIFSALGMLLADAKNEYVISHVRTMNDDSASEMEALFAGTEAEAVSSMEKAGFSAANIKLQRSLEMRYIGQEFTIIVDCPSPLVAESIPEIRKRFNAVYERRYGHAFPQVMPEIVSARLQVIGVFNKPEFRFAPSAATTSKPATDRRLVHFEANKAVECIVHKRSTLRSGQMLQGPIVIEEPSSTTLVGPGDSVTVDTEGNLVIVVGINASK